VVAYKLKEDEHLVDNYEKVHILTAGVQEVHLKG
jgi:hypothetical protein